MKKGFRDFVERMEADLQKKVGHNKISVEKLAAAFGITDKTAVKEFTELAIVNVARKIAHGNGTEREKYNRIVDLYESQINLSHRTSQSILLQQYSTPAPIGYLAGLFCGINKLPSDYETFEPSAGNGLLTIAGNPRHIIVNEIDALRNANLQTQGFRQVLKQDATEPFKDFRRRFHAVITNPPFGRLDKEVFYDSFPISDLDHLMALRALDCMRDEGRAAIIIGGHTKWDTKGRVQAGKNRIFFNYLCRNYYVADILQIDGHKLYSRMGTAFDVRLILIAGRKLKPEGVAPVKDNFFDVEIKSFSELYDRIMGADLPCIMNTDKQNITALEKQAKELEMLFFSESDLGAPYLPASESGMVLNTVVPDSMSFETQSAIQAIKEAVGGDIDEFVRNRLAYASKKELANALSAEQIDAAAMAIYNIEARGQGMIIGDQTGIGKGRVAASMIRYGVVQGHKPIFITEKANLFSDIYRDLVAIGSAHLVPFIVNGRESKTDIKDEDGNVVYQALAPTEQSRIFKDQKIPGRYDFVVATYSQFNSPEKKPEKPAFLRAIAPGNIVIMDESHNSSGSSNTGEFMQGVIRDTKGVVFLSATFAKRPDNMPVYAMKTAISEANMSKDQLVEAIIRGGVALQEVLASQLVAEGQMLRRERSFEGVEVNYMTLTDKAQEHMAISDNITEILRDIIGFQTNHVDTIVEELDDIAVAEGKEVDLREGTSQAGVDNLPYFSKVFQVINQMLFSIKAESVAERAILRLKEGKKPVIAFASTMGSFIEQMENEAGVSVGDGDTINADFSVVLQRGLEGILRYTETEPDGSKTHKKFEVSDLPPEAQADYLKTSQKIRKASTGITISPIDVIVRKIKEAGYSVAEVTGRKYELQINPRTNMGLVKTRKKINTNDAFRKFNNNEVDVLLINQSGSTGASAHAIPTSKVPASEVKQRVMIVLQAELDINTEVQKRGRINRTGQILKPIYDYVNSAIPAEMRLMMMLQKKLKSLDANTTSNQKQSTKILDVPDFLNKYGDKIVKEYLIENPEINLLLDDPLGLKKTEKQQEALEEDAAHKVSGRVAVLSTKMQQDFYSEISSRYNDQVEYLKQIGEYDLEVEAMDLDAELVSSKIVKVGKGGASEFGDDSIMETIRANVLKKPYSRTELENILSKSLAGTDAHMQQRELLNDYQQFITTELEKAHQEDDVHYAEIIRNIPNEKKVQKARKEGGDAAFMEAIRVRERELNEAKAAKWQKTERDFANRRSYVEGLFNFFYVGRPLYFPVETYDKGEERIFCVFVGYGIDRKKRNPFAPSGIKLQFALSNSNKYIPLPASYNKDVNAIKGASMNLADEGLEDTLRKWEYSIKENTVDRKIRYAITGNLLQAFSDFKGKLVSFTTKGGGVKKGILMPEYWEPGEEGTDKVSVPISKALKIIKGLGFGSQIHTNNDISLFRTYEGFKIIVPASRSKGGEIYLDTDLLELVEKNNFEKTSDKMVAVLPEHNLEAFVEVLQTKFGTSVTLTPFQFDMIKNDIVKRDTSARHFPRLKTTIHPQPKQPKQEANIIRLMEMEAMALELELELLNFAA